MDLFEAFRTRRSVSPRFLGAPGPSAEQLEEAFRAGLTAPDHGGLKPWRFLVVEGEGLQRLADLYAEGLKAGRPDATVEDIATAREKAMRSPLLIVVGATITEGKIPAVEQVAAAACAAQNLLLAFHAQGYGAMLVTGPRAYDPVVKSGFGFKPEDEIVGFIHVGTPAEGRPRFDRPRPEPAEHVRRWPA